MSELRNTPLSTTYRNASLIYNPAAGGLKGRRGKRLDRALAILREAGHAITPAPTRGPSSAGEIARECAARGADLILVLGGDGTINEAANGMIGSGVPLGILSGGTANVLAMELGIGGSVENAARRLGEWTPRRVAAGLLRAQGGAVARHFLMMAGAGLDALIVNKVHPELKRRHGKLSYWVTTLRELGSRLAEFDVRVGGCSWRCSFALASRVRNYGGVLEIARGASLAGDEFEVVLFEGSNALRYVKYFLGVATHTLPGMRGVTILRTRELEFSAPAGSEVYVQVDGEAAGLLPATVEIVPGAITLLAPPEFQG